MGAWDKAKPAASTSLRNSNPEILANWTALETAITQDHEFSTGGTNSGEHKQIKFNVPVTTPTNAANKGWLYSKDVSAVVELHWLDESNNELQITSGGDLFSSTGLVVTGTTTLNGSLTLGAGDDLLLSTTSDITISGNTFTVAGATGNTVIAGTLAIAGITTVTGGLADGSVLVAATESGDGDRTISDKAFVDAHGIVQIVNTQTGAVNTGTTQMPYDDTIPQNTEGDEYMTLAITPTSATNKLLIEVVIVLANSSSGAHDALSVALFQDSTANALAGISNHLSFVNEPIILNFKHFMTTGTSSETTFKVRAGLAAAGTMTFNGQSTARRLGGITMSSITITEIGG